MSIDRDIDRLSPVKNKPRDKQPTPMPQSSSASSLRLGGQIDNDSNHYLSGLLKSSGNASLDAGNNYRGLPQVNQEIAGYAERLVNLGERQGNITLKLGVSNVFQLVLTGPSVILLDTSSFPVSSYSRQNGLDLSVSILINKGEFPLTINADRWGPNGSAPNLTEAGYYEISMAVAIRNNFLLTRAWCVIKDV